NLGNALARQGKPGAAEAAFREALGLKPDHAPAYYNLGLVLMQQSQFDKAALALEKAGELFPASDPHRETARRLQQRCPRYAILDTRLPGILRGTEQPANAAEQIDLAQLWVFKKRYTAAARFFCDAFTAERKLAEAVAESTRYNAACAAALAGCGQGKDADELDDKERTRLRHLALGWLRADLEAWGGLLAREPDRVRPVIADQMRHWLAATHLPGLPRPPALP